MEQSVTFPSGGSTLEGLLSLPAVTPAISVVICHPHPLYGGDMRNNVVSGMARVFQSSGMATLRFNFRGVGANMTRASANCPMRPRRSITCSR